MVKKVNNHPVHLINEEGELLPTALVPFCSVSGNFSVMGTKIDELDVPVCSSFKAKILEDQLCYEVDPNNYIKYLEVGQEVSLSFFIHYNEDRQLTKLVDEDEDPTKILSKNTIIIETIGNTNTV